MKTSINTTNDNFSRGLFQVDIPELGEAIRGKVRDNWIINQNGSKYRLIVTTDRQSINAKPVCTIPGKGQTSNIISAYWFNLTKDIIANHLIDIPHPNILFAKQAKKVIPVEVIVRRYLAKGSTPTSIYYNYFEKGRREIYGIKFPDDLFANQELPMGTIITPTTKAPDGNDQELSDFQTQNILDQQVGRGSWDMIKSVAYRIFEKARQHCLDRGIIIADTKFEFGVDENDNVMLIDEILTPECSRLWIAETYSERFQNGETPDPDKDTLINWLLKNNFNSQVPIPRIDPEIINKMSEMQAMLYSMITGNDLPIPTNNPDDVKKAALNYLVKNHH